jgi:hypothetical protein
MRARRLNEQFCIMMANCVANETKLSNGTEMTPPLRGAIVSAELEPRTRPAQVGSIEGVTRVGRVGARHPVPVEDAAIRGINRHSQTHLRVFSSRCDQSLDYKLARGRNTAHGHADG